MRARKEILAFSATISLGARYARDFVYAEKDVREEGGMYRLAFSI